MFTPALRHRAGSGLQWWADGTKGAAGGGMSATESNDPLWERRLRYRLMDFEATTRREGRACSLKWRTVRGRFDRVSSPKAYRIIEASVRRRCGAGRWVEVHSNGPELLVYLGERPGGYTLGAEVVGLLAEMAQARTEGARSGDPVEEAIELIVRRFDERGCYVEQVLLSVTPAATTSEPDVVAALGRHGIAVEA